MTSLFYKIVGEFGEYRKGAGSSIKRVRLHIDGIDSGILSIGRLSAPLKDGVCTLSLEGLDDGVYVPKLYYRGAITPLEAIEKCGSSVAICRADPALIRALALRAEELEMRVSELEQKCNEFAEAIEGKPLFAE